MPPLPPFTHRGTVAGLVMLVIAGFLLSGLMGVGRANEQHSTFDDDPNTTDRIDANEPVEFSIQVSEGRFAQDAARHVVLARDDVFVDSLAGSPLSADGPLLFSAGGELSAQTRTELLRVARPGTTVYLLGGPAALSDTVSDAVKRAGFTPTRLGGEDRVATALTIAAEVRRLFPRQQQVALARADQWADSVTGGAWAAAEGVPMLVTASTRLDPRVRARLQQWQTSVVTLLGGPAALSDDLERAIPSRTRRVHGNDRYETASAIAEELWSRPSPRWIVVSGRDEYGWAFGLASAGIASDFSAPVALLGPTDPSEATIQAIDPCAEDVLVAGSNLVVSDAITAAVTQCPSEWPAKTHSLCDTMLAVETRAVLGVPALATSAGEWSGEASVADVCSWDHPVAMQRRIVARRYGASNSLNDARVHLGHRVIDMKRGVAAVHDPGATEIILDTPAGVIRITGEGPIGAEPSTDAVLAFAHAVSRRLQ